VTRGRGSGAGRRASPIRAAASAALLALLGAGPAPWAPPAPAGAATLDERIAPCLACHGADGQSRIPETPSLGGQPAFFVVTQLFLFREGRRESGPMTEMARPLSNDDLRAFSERIATLPPPPAPADPPDPERMARGRAVLNRQPCAVCHNPDFSGREQMPRLAHQREDYLLKAMRGFKSGTRIGYAGAMAVELRDLTDADLADVAHFLAHLPAAR